MKKVLIVNKDDKSAHLLSSALKRYGYDVRHSRASNDVFRLPDQLNPDIVVLHNLGITYNEVQAAEIVLHPSLINAVFVFVAEIITDHRYRELNTRCDVIGNHYAVYPKPIKIGRLLEEIRRWQ